MCMEYTRFGSTGLHVSPICLGSWRFGLERQDSGVMETDREAAHELLDAYEKRGGKFIDTANGYGKAARRGSASGSPTGTERSS